MVKQNFGDGVVFAVALLVASLVQRRHARAGTPPVVAAGGVLGGCGGGRGSARLRRLVPGRLRGRPGPTVFGFRGTALDVIEDHSLHAPLLRAAALVGLAAAGRGPAAARGAGLRRRCAAGSAGRRSRGPSARPLASTWSASRWAAATGRTTCCSWPRCSRWPPGLWAPTRRGCARRSSSTVASAVAATVVVTLDRRGVPQPRPAAVGDFLHRSARPGDTATVLFGNADVQQASGMRSPYDAALDAADAHPRPAPRAAAGGAARSARHRPGWWRGATWTRGTSTPTTGPGSSSATHYRRSPTVCGHVVYLHDGVRRTLAPPPCR